MSLQYNLQYVCTQAGENGLHQKGSSGEGLNWAMRSPWQRGPPRCRAWGECGREFHAEVAWSGGNRSSLLQFWEILMAAVQALAVMNSSHTLTHAHTHTHHYITDNNSYITRPSGHWGNYNELTSVSAGQNKYKHLEIHVPWWQQHNTE